MNNIFNKMFSGEQKEKQETVKEASIRLEFFRHSKQGPQTAGMQEYNRRLTEGPDGGRAMATEAGKDRNPDPEVGLTVASPRDRAQETAYRQLLTNQEEVTSESTLEDIEELIKEKLPVGSKKIVDERLNFNWEGSQKFNEVGMDHFLKVKDTLRFLVEESDDLAVEAKDKESTAYSRAAANTAEIVKKYLSILPNWEKVVASDKEREGDEKKDYAKHGNEMQRFLGSHGATVENFLLKVIDKLEGRAAVLEFIKNLPDQNNFQFNDGYSVKLSSPGGQPEILVAYHNKSWSVKPELLDEIITDRTLLDQKVKESR